MENSRERAAFAAKKEAYGMCRDCPMTPGQVSAFVAQWIKSELLWFDHKTSTHEAVWGNARTSIVDEDCKPKRLPVHPPGTAAKAAAIGQQILATYGAEWASIENGREWVDRIAHNVMRNLRAAEAEALAEEKS